MNESGPPVPASNDQRRWAGQTLNIATSAAVETVRRRALEKLVDEDFVPPEAWHDAIDMLLDQGAGKRPALPAAYYAAREEQLRDEVEKLAGSFFELRPKQRLARWEKLHAFSKHWPPLRLWLERLEPGLEVEFKSLDNEGISLQRVANLIRESFVLPPGQRSRLLLEKLPSMLNSGPFWRPVVKTLRREYPEIAELDKPLLDELTGKTRRKKKPAAAAGEGFFSSILPDNADPSNRGSLVAIWIMLAIIMGILKSCAAYNSQSRQRRVEVPSRAFESETIALELVQTHRDRTVQSPTTSATLTGEARPS